MPTLSLEAMLVLERCPHCGVARPTLAVKHQWTTHDHKSSNGRFWKAYVCSHCGGSVLAAASQDKGAVREIYPSESAIDPSIPSPAGDYLKQAMDTLHAPAGSVMLAASSVDAMLKARGYSKGTLYSRIDQAAEDHLITADMATWAHEVRLDANDQRHADEAAALPTLEAAQKAVGFARALAEFLFVLPARVERGLQQAGKTSG